MNPLLLLRDSCYFFSRHASQIALLCLPFILLEALVQQLAALWFEGPTPAAVQLLIRLFFYPMYTGALILFVDSRSCGLRLRRQQLWAMALWRWPSYAVLAAFTTLLVMLGLSLMILPGLWIMSRLAFAELLLVINGMAPMEAMKESYRMTGGHFVTVFCCLLLAVGPMWGFEWWVSEQLGEHPDTLGSLLADCLDAGLQLFASVLMYRLFSLLAEPAAER